MRYTAYKYTTSFPPPHVTRGEEVKMFVQPTTRFVEYLYIPNASTVQYKQEEMECDLSDAGHYIQPVHAVVMHGR
jgi:hypothetical protein